MIKKGRILVFILFFSFLVLLSMLWIVWNWPYTPEDVLKDVEKMGPYAILIDVFIFIGIAYLALRDKSNTK